MELRIEQAVAAHPDANHNLGVLEISLNKVEKALPLFKTALKKIHIRSCNIRFL
tara:strand:- start:60 stop:221 length:162 start_codon:yes stop_codon:yes gene_type:complete